MWTNRDLPRSRFAPRQGFQVLRDRIGLFCQALVNFINILQAAFAPKSSRQKSQTAIIEKLNKAL